MNRASHAPLEDSSHLAERHMDCQQGPLPGIPKRVKSARSNVEKDEGTSESSVIFCIQQICRESFDLCMLHAMHRLERFFDLKDSCCQEQSVILARLSAIPSRTKHEDCVPDPRWPSRRRFAPVDVVHFVRLVHGHFQRRRRPQAGQSFVRSVRSRLDYRSRPRGRWNGLGGIWIWFR